MRSSSSRARAVSIACVLALLIGAAGLTLRPERTPDRPPEQAPERPGPPPARRAPAPPPDPQAAAPAPTVPDPTPAPAPVLAPAPAPADDAPGVIVGEGPGRLARVRGVVVGPDDAPRAGVLVEVRGGQLSAVRRAGRAALPRPTLRSPLLDVLGAPWDVVREPLGTVRSAVDGTFELPLRPDHLVRLDSLLVIARDPTDGALGVALLDHLPDCPDGVLVTPLRLRAPSRVEVRARTDGAPLAGVRVELELRVPVWGGELQDQTDVRARLAVSTGDDGAVALDLIGEELVVTAMKEGHGSARRELARLEGPVRLDLELPRADALRGLVLGADGRPCSNAQVSASPQDPERPDVHDQTDAQGAFLLEALAPGQRYRISARHETSAMSPAWTEVVLPAPDVVLRLGPAGSLLVSVDAPPVDSPWQVQRTEVELLRAEGADWVRPEAPDDGGVGPDEAELLGEAELQGRRRLRAGQRLLLGLLPGRYRVRAHEPMGGGSSAYDEVEVRAGEESSLALALVPPRRLRLRLIDFEGASVPGVKVELAYALLDGSACWYHVSDASGEVELERISPFVTEVEVRREGFTARRLPVGKNDDLGDVYLAPVGGR